MKLPKTIKVFDSIYEIKYFDSYVEVDPNRRELMEGCLDHESAQIRIYRNNRSYRDIMQTVWHETTHSIGEKMKLECIRNDDPKGDEIVDAIAIAINTIIFDNKHIWETKKDA